MRIDVLTLFPEMFAGPFSESVIKRAQAKGLITICLHNLRKWTKDSHHSVDDHPYGGGIGMVLMVEPIYEALKELKKKDSRVLLMTPQGVPFVQTKAQKLAEQKHLIIIAGHYEGFDERIREHLVDEEISIGDFVLTGGEIPTMAIIDSIVRLIPDVLKEDATKYESFGEGLLEYPQYTRPENFKGWKVPTVLLSGNHKEINKWRNEKAKAKTKARRPDLLAKSEI